MMRRLVLAALGLSLALATVGAADAQSRRRPAAAPADPTKASAPTAKTQSSASSAPDAAKAPRGANPDQPVNVDADKLESDQKQGLVIFTGNVIAQQNGSTQYADRMEVYLDSASNRVLRTVSTGSVKIITRDCRTGTAQRAEYYDAEQRVVLIGDARVWQDENVVTGDRITIYLAEDRSVVEGGPQGRVKGVFYPKREGEGAAVAARPTPGAACKQS
ncbi:MAG TPA: lipopolysaccharide transport periplasmic protein LptA [Verrucomicrobiae bacterium]|jgi:lipopolysaccharide export system protein LptA|nr:lipopolysaccharide transport periplasmic protein LptA [Verrucomicrobiae bacterium]